MSEVVLIPTAELTNPIKGHKRLTDLVAALETRIGHTSMQLVFMDVSQLNQINRQMQAADYYMQKVRAYTIDVEEAWKTNDRIGLAKAIGVLEAFVMRAEEPGDNDEPS